MNFSKKSLLLVFLIIAFTIWQSSVIFASKKQDISSLLTILPTEIQANIISYLPQISPRIQAIFKHTYYLSEKNRIRAFKNYLMYPYLSKFNIKPSNTSFKHQIVPFKIDSETGLEKLFDHDNNKQLFYSLLFKEVHPDYLVNKEWRDFFKIKLTRINLKNFGNKAYIDVVSFKNEIQWPNNKDTINKIMIVNIGTHDEIRNFDIVQKHIAEKQIVTKARNKDRIKKDDNIRIIFSYGQDKVDDINESSYRNYVFYLMRSLYQNFFNEDINVKILDITKVYHDESLSKNIATLPYLLYVTLQGDQEDFLLKNSFRKNQPNIVPKPYYYKSNWHVRKKSDLIALKYLCQKNFSLQRIQNLLEFSNKALLNDIMNILVNYVSPLAVIPNGKIFIDYMFLISLNYSNDNMVNFLSVAHQYGIDINTYYSQDLKSTFLVYMLNNFIFSTNQSNPLTLEKIKNFIRQGVDLFFDVNQQITLGNFFLNLSKFGKNTSNQHTISFTKVGRYARIGGLNVLATRKFGKDDDFEEDWDKQKLMQLDMLKFLLENQKKFVL